MSPAVPADTSGLRVSICTALAILPEAAWDALLDADDAPLLSWAYLQGLEETGCVGDQTGWQPAHILIHREDDDALLAAAPAYVKSNSDGEWVFDLDWAAFAEQHLHAQYFPKLVLSVPFNPVTGGRLLTRPDLGDSDRKTLRRLLLAAAQTLCKTARLSSVHLQFARATEVAEASALGYLPRQQEQYHFLNSNPGYRDFEDFLGRMRGHRRNTIRRERRALAEAGIVVRTHRGPRSDDNPDGFLPEELDRVFEMYVATSVRYTGDKPYLNRAFFHLCAERPGLRERLELVLARRRDGQIVGGAWNLRGDRRLLGRYWGEAEHIPFLHFEVCFYHSVERCIAEGLTAFEPGHGGEQKLVRGFTPVRVYSAHHLRDLRLRRTIAAFLEMEAPLAEQSLADAIARCPLRMPAADAAPESRPRPQPAGPAVKAPPAAKDGD